MRFHKLLSTLLHPIVIPTVGVILYFLLIPTKFNSAQQLYVLALIFVATYLIPLLILVFLKVFGKIKSYNLSSISERKLPLGFMIVLFYLLGNTLYRISYIRDIGLLFFATSLGLLLVYILFILKLKTSLHLLSMGLATGFFMYLSTLYTINIIPIIILFVVLSGFLASARLHLKAHTSKEVYTGFLLGILCPFLVCLFL